MTHIFMRIEPLFIQNGSDPLPPRRDSLPRRRDPLPRWRDT